MRISRLAGNIMALGHHEFDLDGALLTVRGALCVATIASRG